MSDPAQPPIDLSNFQSLPHHTTWNLFRSKILPVLIPHLPLQTYGLFPAQKESGDSSTWWSSALITLGSENMYDAMFSSWENAGSQLDSHARQLTFQWGSWSLTTNNTIPGTACVILEIHHIGLHGAGLHLKESEVKYRMRDAEVEGAALTREEGTALCSSQEYQKGMNNWE